jgi:hypothetical protein
MSWPNHLIELVDLAQYRLFDNRVVITALAHPSVAQVLLPSPNPLTSILHDLTPNDPSLSSADEVQQTRRVRPELDDATEVQLLDDEQVENAAPENFFTLVGSARITTSS